MMKMLFKRLTKIAKVSVAQSNGALGCMWCFCNFKLRYVGLIFQKTKICRSNNPVSKYTGSDVQHGKNFLKEWALHCMMIPIITNMWINSFLGSTWILFNYDQLMSIVINKMLDVNKMLPGIVFSTVLHVYTSGYNLSGIPRHKMLQYILYAEWA